MVEQNLLILLVALPFLSALVAATLPQDARNAEAWLAGLTMLAMLLVLGQLHGWVQDGGVVVSNVRWVDAIGLNLRFRIDGFAWLFMMLVAGIGLLVVIYARYYLSKDDPSARFYSSILAFAGSMSGVLLSGNILMMVVFWELTSITSFMLISYWNQKPESRDGARTALVVTAAGGLCLLAAMLMIGQIVGSYSLDAVLAAGDRIRSHALYTPILCLFLLGAFTKSAQFPFHFWLPNAMAAPTPVSAYLHSATMVKAGVFLLVRFFPALGGTDQWFAIVTSIGMLTMLIGAYIALFQKDLKGVLAYSTISNLGLITALAGIGSPLALVAAVFHIVNHAVFKASLFMAAGIVDHETGTRDLDRLSGLMKWLPITGTLAIVSTAAMAGVPLLNGFLSKEMFFDVAYDWNNGSLLDLSLPYVATLASAFSVAYSLRFIMKVFFGPPATDLPHMPPHEPPALMRRPVELLVLICLAIGILPATTIGPWLHDAVLGVLGRATPEYSLKIWHGINAPLIMSIIATTLGAAIYLIGRRLIDRAPVAPILGRVNAQAVFDRIMATVTGSYPRKAYSLMNGPGLQTQLRVLVLLALACGFLVLPGTRWWPRSPVIGEQEILFGLLWLVGAACALGAAWQAKYHRFAALVMMGGAGLVTCVSFVWLSAPDLAVTQLLVEIVTTVVLLLGLRWLPQRNEEIPGDNLRPAKIRRLRDLAIATCGGAGIAAIAYAVMSVRPGPNVGDWFLRNAYSEGGGTNVVNVILVDFRAFDTFGEIAVLAIVALTVYVLLRRFRPTPESARAPSAQRSSSGTELSEYLYVPSIIMNWMFAASIALAAYLFFRGHDLPGGGFAGGVTLAVGLLLQYIATNVRWVEARLVVLPVRWIATGLTGSIVVGAGSWLFGYPFLTAHAQYIEIPLIGQVPAATALLFDLGVFSVVLGATVLMLIAIAHQSLRTIKPRKSATDTDKKER